MLRSPEWCPTSSDVFGVLDVIRLLLWQLDYFAFDICKNIIHKDFNGHGYMDFVMPEYSWMEFWRITVAVI